MEARRVALVCSARSGRSKREGTTSRLLCALDSVLKPNSMCVIRDIISGIESDHLHAALQIMPSTSEAYIEYEESVKDECARLEKFLEAAEIIDEVSSRSKDVVLAAGERLSCRLVVAALCDAGVDAELVALEKVVQREMCDDQYRHGSTSFDQEFFDRVALAIQKRIRECGDRVPVVTGYFGPVPGGIVDAVGRGYTDVCAALIATPIVSSDASTAHLDVDELQIWKEVDGIFTADPRKVPSARLLHAITPDEAAELTYYGSEVVHPACLERAVVRGSVPVRIKNVGKPSGKGTIVYPQGTAGNGHRMSEVWGESPMADSASGTLHAKPTAVTIKDDVVIVNVHSNRRRVSHGFFADVFACLDRFNIIVDLISTSEVHVSMAISASADEETGYDGSGASGRFRTVIHDLSKLGDVKVHPKMAIVSVVGREMRAAVGMSARMFGTLAEAGINIEMISQGASEINISCVIASADAIRALVVIHDRMIIGTEQ